MPSHAATTLVLALGLLLSIGSGGVLAQDGVASGVDALEWRLTVSP